ncbi:fibroblast growth factor-binding protein 1 [Salarias fasciatus]|uniref:Fibroblast growth factor binding protein 1b n=1 Tax=Salarias fasciatus TaxID=181472 RepID=A0A672G872_SALFA|nr:fibroblast growth factor-binding protein 1 [Salarias fasciatus]XP_029964179.1 fibroblast growth factor-binding protein 1 [Salarias fasciatus]
MALLTNLTVLLVLACVSHQLALCGCQRSPGRRGRSSDRGPHRDRSGLKVSRHPKSVSAQPIRGKLVTKAKEECTWAAAGEDVLVLGLTCRKGDSSFSCEYVGRPDVCPQYSSNTKLYWKQIARSLKKQRRLCRDGDALVRTGLCRRAARDAHFRLRTARPPAAPLQPTARTACRGENKQLAEEYCSGAWSSFCNFFITMVNDNDC